MSIQTSAHLTLDHPHGPSLPDTYAGDGFSLSFSAGDAATAIAGSQETPKIMWTSDHKVGRFGAFREEFTFNISPSREGQSDQGSGQVPTGWVSGSPGKLTLHLLDTVSLDLPDTAAMTQRKSTLLHSLHQTSGRGAGTGHAGSREYRGESSYGPPTRIKIWEDADMTGTGYDAEIRSECTPVFTMPVTPDMGPRPQAFRCDSGTTTGDQTEITLRDLILAPTQTHQGHRIRDVCHVTSKELRQMFILWPWTQVCFRGKSSNGSETSMMGAVRAVCERRPPPEEDWDNFVQTWVERTGRLLSGLGITTEKNHHGRVPRQPLFLEESDVCGGYFPSTINDTGNRMWFDCVLGEPEDIEKLWCIRHCCT